MSEQAAHSPPNPSAPTRSAPAPSLIRSILDEVAAGISLAKACRDAGRSIGTIWPHLAKTYWDDYQAAVLRRAALWAEELVDLSDDASEDRNPDGKGNMAAVARSRLQVDTRKWLLSKLIPRQYGDTVALTGADGGPLQITWAQSPVIDVVADKIERSSDVSRETGEPEANAAGD